MIPIVIQANAKINLALNIIKKRSDNYHELDMISIPLKLHDTIELSRIKETANKFSAHLYCDDPNIECDETNTAYQAFSLYQEKCKIKDLFKIFIYKRIPIQAGLGGGSSDAAAVLKALNQFTKCKNEICNINKLAPSLGADVPFFLTNKPSRVKGFGDIIEPINITTSYYVLLVKPKEGLSTVEVYDLYDQMDKKKIQKSNIDELITGLKENNYELIKKNLINALYYPASQKLPVIKKILTKLEEFNLPLNGMSGSGSACFALSEKKSNLKKAYKYFYSLPGYSAFLTEFVL